MKIVSDKLVEECTETVEEMKLAEITIAEIKNEHKYRSGTLYIVLFSILFTTNVGIGTFFVYFYWFLKIDDLRVELVTKKLTKKNSTILNNRLT